MQQALDGLQAEGGEKWAEYNSTKDIGMGGLSGAGGTVINNDPLKKDVPKSAVIGALVPAISGEASVAAAGTSGKIQTVVSLNSAVVGVAAEKIQKVKPKKVSLNNKEGGKQ